jgi:hypothetical protein
MAERRFVLVDFTHMSRAGCPRLYEPGRAYALPRVIAYAATKRDLVAVERPVHWVAPSMFCPPKTLTEAEVIEAEEELRALRRHDRELVDPEFRGLRTKSDRRHLRNLHQILHGTDVLHGRLF